MEQMLKRITNTCIAVLLGSVVGASSQAQDEPDIQTQEARPSLVDVVFYPKANSRHPVPQFKVAPGWPNLPEDWIIGQVPGLAVDTDDNVWLLHRPNSLNKLDLGLTNDIGLCCKAAPHVLQFSSQGELLNAWGGADIAPTVAGMNQWPENVHGLYVDKDNTVWLGGNGDGDHVVLNFTAQGRFIKQIGQRGQTEGNESKTFLGNPADVFHDATAKRVYIADGYINKRIAAFSTTNNQFDQFWGAYGNIPGGGSRTGAFDVSQATANAENTRVDAEHFGDIVHCVTQSDDGRIYVCDRRNNRIQIFTLDEQGKVNFLKDLVIAGDTGGLGTASDIAFSPDNRYMYVADMMNGRIWILWHETYEVLGSFGRPGRYAGEFTWLHSVVSDSKGNLYTSEVNTGRRVQKFVLTSFTQ